MEITGDDVITHDDRLLVRAQKHEIGLESDWRDAAPEVYKDGHPVVLGYWRWKNEIQGEMEFINVGDYAMLTTTEKGKWRRMFERGCELADGISVNIKNNQVDLRICNLFEDWRSRYRIALESMVRLEEKGILKYSPTKEPSERNRLEAIRNRLKRYGKPTEYEYDILVRGELGRRMRSELESKAKHREENTLYLAGSNRFQDTKYSVKFYDVEKRDGQGEGDKFKLEITMLKEYFKASGMGITELTEQPEIQEKMTEELVRIVGKAIRLLEGDTIEMLAEAVQVDSRDRRRAPELIARAIISRPRTLTERVSALERD